MLWSSEQVDEIRGHIAKGLSRGAIAQIYGVTRNAVVGICYRKGITGTNNPMFGAVIANERRRRAKLLKSAERPNVQKKNTHDRWVRRAKSIVVKFVAPENEPVPLRISLRDLTNLHCHNPIGETDDDCYPFYCGHPTKAESAYCQFHHTLFHTTWRRRS